MYESIICLRFRSLGTPSTRATEFTENVVACSDVGTDEFLSVISGGKLKLDSVKI